MAAGGQCNVGMPANVFDRFLWVINYYARAGFYVVVDNHVWLEDPTAYEDPAGWVRGWVKLARAIDKVRACCVLEWALLCARDGELLAAARATRQRRQV